MAARAGVTALMAAAVMLGVAGARAGVPMAPAPTKSVDLNRFYSGTWIEIGRHPMKITDGCVAGATEYRAIDATHINVRDTCHKGTPSGKLQAIGGPAVLRDPGTNAKLHVTYQLFGFIPLGRDYWVLDHDDDYRWFISSDPAFKNLWIYTRDPHVDPGLLRSLVAKAKAFGYDTSQLEFPAQP